MQSQYCSNFWVILLFLASVAACEKNTEDAHAADAQAIRAAELAAVHAFNDGDIDGYMAAYPADSAWLPPNAPTVAGAESIRDLASQLAANPGFAFDVEVETIEVSGDGKMAYLVGAYELTLSDADGNLGTDYGKFVEVWKKHPDDMEPRPGNLELKRHVVRWLLLAVSSPSAGVILRGW
jgi:ketosteroid isomerase-like protein